MNVAEESFKDFAAKSDEALDIYMNYTNAKKMYSDEVRMRLFFCLKL